MTEAAQEQSESPKLASHFTRLSKDTLIYGLGGALGSVIGILLAPILTRLFSPEDYGIIEIITTAFSFITVFVVFGFDSALQILYFKTDDASEKRRLVTTSLVFPLAASIVCMGIVIAWRSAASSFLFSTSGYAPLIAISMIGTPFWVYALFGRNLLRLQFQPWKYTLISIIQVALIPTLTIIAVIVFKTGVEGYFIATSIGYAVSAVLTAFFVKLSPFETVTKRIIPSLLRLGAPLVPAGLASWVMSSIDRFFLVRMATLEEVGLYSIGFKIASAMFLIVVAFRLAWNPFSLSIERSKDSHTVYSRMSTYYSTFSLWAFLGVSIFARELLLLLTAPEFRSASPVVAPLAMSIVLFGLVYVFFTGANLAKRTEVSLWSTLIAAIVNVILNMILIPSFGMQGAAYATAIAYVVSAASMYAFSQRYYPIPYDLRRLFGLFAIGVLLAAAGIFSENMAQPFALLIKTICFAAFPFLIIALDLLHKSDVQAGIQEAKLVWSAIRKRRQ